MTGKGCTPAAIPVEKDGRRLIWHDEFNGDTLNMDHWSFVRLMDNEISSYINDRRHIRVEDGMLHMQAHREKDGFSLCEACTTKGKLLFKYGYLEMRARLPFRHCAWPSFWMLGNTAYHDDAIGWFAEVDIFEVFSSADSLSPNLHKWRDGENHEMLPGAENGVARRYTFQNPETLNDEFHVYGFSWDEREMGFYVDDKRYFSIRIDGESPFVSEKWPDARGFHEPLYINLNNEFFTDRITWLPEAAVRDSDPFPIDYYVDWIRLYQNPDKESIYYIGHD